MIVVGIDPGITGAVSWFTDGKLTRVEDLPMIKVKVGKGFRTRMVPGVLADLLGTLPQEGVQAFLEQVSSRPQEGAVGAFSFGRCFGQIEGILAGMLIPYTLVTPAVWKKAVGAPADKGLSRMLACRQFPEFATQFAHAKDDGRAEACLIGLYGVGGAA